MLQELEIDPLFRWPELITAHVFFALSPAVALVQYWQRRVDLRVLARGSRWAADDLERRQVELEPARLDIERIDEIQ